MHLVRKPWFRVTVVLTAVACSSLLLAFSSTWHSLRLASVTALQSVTLLYAVISALSIALYSNYVKGLRETYLKQVSNVRDLLEKFFDEHASSDDPDIQEIIGDFIYPLLQLAQDEWLTFDEVSAARGNIDEAALRLRERKPWILWRHLLRIEDELNELGLIFIKRLVTQVNVDLIRGTFMLIVVAMTAIALAHVLPDISAVNALVVAFCSALIAWAAIQTILLLSFYEQEALHEVGPLDKEAAEDEQTDA
ncbi:MAG: hypothetical protein EKK46_06940 [Rhodocyclaceae bacterium]|nr:MAG: hypothetical protein EKK46_06940 [Rhodocyclaceae bacterium]